ncbi:MAG: DUF11 domain-containing protein [Proteobacteria bacterium]|nr:DUF11 domain-containing protein [Pseudomonadota bacterium]
MAKAHRASRARGLQEARGAHLRHKGVFALMACLLLLPLAGGAQAQVRWEDYRGRSSVPGIVVPGANTNYENLGASDTVRQNLREIFANPLAAPVRTGTSTNIDYGLNTALCNATVAPAGAACVAQAQGRVVHALIRFPAAGAYDLAVAHDDEVEVLLSSDFANTNYASAVYDIPVGSLAGWTNDVNTFASIGQFSAPVANSCALVRMYWNNQGGQNFARLRWTTPGGTTQIIPTANLFDPSLAASSAGCNGSITSTSVTLGKAVGGAGRLDATDQFTVQIASAASGGTVYRAATTTGTAATASTGAHVATPNATYFLRDSMAAGSASPIGSYIPTIQCTRNGVAFTPSGSAPNWSVVPAAGNQIACTITNTPRPTITLNKAVASRAIPPDQFLVQVASAASGGTVFASATTTGTGTSASTGAYLATAGTTYHLRDSMAAGSTSPLASYNASIQCTRNGVAFTPTGSGPTWSVVPAAGERIECTITNASSQPNFGTCDARMFLSQAPNNTTNTTLYGINTATNPFLFPTLGQGTHPYNAIGYNPVDNYIYGIRNASGDGNQLIRIGADGSTINLGAVGSMATQNWVNGTFSDTGVYYVLAGGGSTNLRVIDVHANTSTLVNLSASVNAVDMAWIGGLIYTVQTNGLLRSINPATGQVLNIGTAQGAVQFGAMYGSPTGLFGNNNEGGFYKIDLLTGTWTLVSSSPGASINDGANCPTAPITFPADLAVTKTNTPAQGPVDLADDTYLPGETRSYSIVVRNNGPFGVQNASVSDPLPAGITAATWTCASTSGGAVCGQASGTGAINDAGLDLPVGAVATYTFTFTVPVSFTGPLANTVTVGVPAGYSDPDPSNNVATDTDAQNLSADLGITKTNTPASGSVDLPGDALMSGAQTVYTIVARNDGPAAAHGAILTDPAPQGLTCTAVACTGVAGGAACPVVSLAALQAGVPIPVFPAGGSVTIELTCTVD